MKKISYKALMYSRQYNSNTECVENVETIASITVPWTAETEENVKGTAYNGEYIIVEEPDLPSDPTQLDVIEAQVAYTAMMTDTLLEV